MENDSTVREAKRRRSSIVVVVSLTFITQKDEPTCPKQQHVRRTLCSSVLGKINLGSDYRYECWCNLLSCLVSWMYSVERFFTHDSKCSSYLFHYYYSYRILFNLCYLMYSSKTGIKISYCFQINYQYYHFQVFYLGF
jgi:hypothetical protein